MWAGCPSSRSTTLTHGDPRPSYPIFFVPNESTRTSSKSTVMEGIIMAFRVEVGLYRVQNLSGLSRLHVQKGIDDRSTLLCCTIRFFKALNLNHLTTKTEILKITPAVYLVSCFYYLPIFHSTLTLTYSDTLSHSPAIPQPPLTHCTFNA